MAKVHTYLVSFSPAERTNWGSYTITFDISKASERHEVTASSLPDLDWKVRNLAAAYGRTCSPYVRLKDRSARKPAGFDTWRKTLNIIDYVPAPVADAA